MKRSWIQGVIAVCATLQAAAGEAQSIRGTVFDSLTMQPLAGALVLVQGAPQSAISDSLGRFQLNGVTAGKHFIAFSAPALDSLGLSTLGSTVTVSGTIENVQLATPSFRSLWGRLCGAQYSNGDSGIVWGTVRDAATDTRLSGARTFFEWTEPRVDSNNQISSAVRTRDVRTDSTGTYYACALPVATNLGVEASGARSSSATIGLNIGQRRMTRLDLLVSSEMVLAPPTTPDSTRRIPRGTSTVRGVVRDDRQRPVADVVVSLSSRDSVVRSRSDGSFVFTNVPAGSAMLSVRRLRLSPYNAVVEIRPGRTTEVSVDLVAATELETVNVRANAGLTSDRDEFESRRKTGFGYALTEKDFEQKYDMVSVLRQLPSMEINKSRTGVVTITPPPTSVFTPCAVRVLLDGTPSSLDEATLIPMEKLRAVEWYPRPTTAPAKYVGLQACSVIMFWTVNSRWGK